jgi:TM2 domain-containing membrane protein YozV
MAVLIVLCIIVILGFLFEKKHVPVNIKSVGTAYILWIFSFFGLLGFHRFYIGKYGTGFLWMFTGGIFGMGAFIDLFTLSSQVKKNNLLVNPNTVNFSANQNYPLNRQFNTKLNKELTQQNLKKTYISVSEKTEQEMKDELVQNILKNIKITVTTSSSTKSIYDDSIIDVTDQSYRINSNNNLKKHSSGVPYWAHHYVYSYSELNSASVEQKKFYGIFKINFLNGEYFDLEGNTNYAFILLFDLLNEYDSHKDISKLESQLKILGQCYPKTKSYGISFLIEKMELNGYSDDVSRLRAEDRYGYQNYNSNYDYDYWRLGSKYKSKLNLNDEEVNLLNKLWYPSNNFCGIEFCCLEVLKLYIAVISVLNPDYAID